MSIIQRKGQEVVEHLKRKSYIDQRKRDVDRAWAKYISESLSRLERGEEHPYKYGFEELNRQTDAYVKRMAGQWAYYYRKYRIYEDEFESYFRFTVAKAALRYDGESGTFYDYLRGALRNAGRDIVKSALTKKSRHNHLAQSLDDKKVRSVVLVRHAVRDVEEAVIAKATVDEMAAEPSLNEQERRLFDYLRYFPDATLQEMADKIGVRDRKQALRVKKRLASKLTQYL